MMLNPKFENRDLNKYNEWSIKSIKYYLKNYLLLFKNKKKLKISLKIKKKNSFKIKIFKFIIYKLNKISLIKFYNLN